MGRGYRLCLHSGSVGRHTSTLHWVSIQTASTITPTLLIINDQSIITPHTLWLPSSLTARLGRTQPSHPQSIHRGDSRPSQPINHPTFNLQFFKEKFESFYIAHFFPYGASEWTLNSANLMKVWFNTVNLLTIASSVTFANLFIKMVGIM